MLHVVCALALWRPQLLLACACAVQTGKSCVLTKLLPSVVREDPVFGVGQPDELLIFQIESHRLSSGVSISFWPALPSTPAPSQRPHKAAVLQSCMQSWDRMLFDLLDLVRRCASKLGLTTAELKLASSTPRKEPIERESHPAAVLSRGRRCAGATDRSAAACCSRHHCQHLPQHARALPRAPG